MLILSRGCHAYLVPSKRDFFKAFFRNCSVSVNLMASLWSASADSSSSISDETLRKNPCLKARGSSLKALAKRILGDWE